MASTNETRTLQIGSVTVVLKHLGGGNFEATYQRNRQHNDHSYQKQTKKDSNNKLEKKESKDEDDATDVLLESQVSNLENGTDNEKETHSPDNVEIDEVLQDSGLKEEKDDADLSDNSATEHEQSKEKESYKGTNINPLPNTGTSEKCNFGSCTRRFSDKTKLLKHIKLYHKGFIRCGCQGCRKKTPFIPHKACYQIQCVVCRATYPTMLSHFNKYLTVIIREGIGIFCTGCNKNTDATVEAMDQKHQVEADTIPGEKLMMRCRLEGCEPSMFSSIRGYSNHLSMRHPELEVEEDPSSLAADTNDSDQREKDLPKPFKCSFKGCLVAYSKKRHLTIHMKRHKSGSLRKCKCLGCAEHAENDVNLKKEQKVVRTRLRPPHEFSCSSCNTVFIMHIRIDHQFVKDGIKFKCHHCDAVEESGQWTLCSDTNLSPAKGFDILCSHCDKKFVNLSSLSEHLKHYSTETVTCTLCNTKVRNITNMRHHWPHCKALANPCSCNKCGKDFLNQYALANHLSKAHKARSYMCDKCGQGFVNLSNLKRHSRTHGEIYESEPRLKAEGSIGGVQQDESPVECEICGKNFSSKMSMKQHQKRTHVMKDKVCMCGKTFKTSCQLKRHYNRMHSEKERGFPCDACGKKYVVKNELERHKRCAHQGLTLTCRYCDKSFRSNFGLKKHEERHTTEPEKYLCELCNKIFISKEGYTIHMKRHLE